MTRFSTFGFLTLDFLGAIFFWYFSLRKKIQKKKYLQDNLREIKYWYDVYEHQGSHHCAHDETPETPPQVKATTSSITPFPRVTPNFTSARLKTKRRSIQPAVKPKRGEVHVSALAQGDIVAAPWKFVDQPGVEQYLLGEVGKVDEAEKTLSITFFSDGEPADYSWSDPKTTKETTKILKVNDVTAGDLFKRAVRSPSAVIFSLVATRILRKRTLPRKSIFRLRSPDTIVYSLARPISAHVLICSPDLLV